MDLRRRLIAKCIRQDLTVDFGAFLQHLLLFETYVIDSARLLEIPALINVFGLEPVLRALNSGAVRINHAICSMGDTLTVATPMHYNLVHVHDAPPSSNLDLKLRRAKGNFREQLTLIEHQKLENAIRRAVVASP